MTVKEILKNLIGPSERDDRIRRMIEESRYNEIRVEGRGTLSVDPQELLNIEGFKEESDRLLELVNHEPR
jgi:hypothetical protein